MKGNTIYRTLTLLALTTLTLLTCSYSQGEKVKNALSRYEGCADEKSGKHLVMKEYAPFEWDTCFIFPPYSYSDGALGFSWKGGEYAESAEHDGYCLLVFVKGKRVVAHLDYPRGHVDFSEAFRKEGYTPENAIFAPTPGEYGYCRLLPTDR